MNILSAIWIFLVIKISYYSIPAVESSSTFKIIKKSFLKPFDYFSGQKTPSKIKKSADQIQKNVENGTQVSSSQSNKPTAVQVGSTEKAIASPDNKKEAHNEPHKMKIALKRISYSLWAVISPKYQIVTSTQFFEFLLDKNDVKNLTSSEKGKLPTFF